MRRTALAALLAAAAAFSAGCHSESGRMYSADQFTYVSREWQPWTVSLIDTRTGESLWSVDIPVGQQLVVGFRKGQGPNPFKPDMMDWGLMPAGHGYGEKPNQLPVPPAPARRLEPTLRPTPELPGTAMPGSPFETTSEIPQPMASDPAGVNPAPGISPVPIDPAQPDPMNEPVTEPTNGEQPVDLPQGSRHQ